MAIIDYQSLDIVKQNDRYELLITNCDVYEAGAGEGAIFADILNNYAQGSNEEIILPVDECEILIDQTEFSEEDEYGIPQSYMIETYAPAIVTRVPK